MRKGTVLGFFLTIGVPFGCLPALGQATQPAADPANQPGSDVEIVLTHDAAPSAGGIPTADAMINDLKDQFLKSKQLQIGTDNPGDAYVGWGEEVVTLPAMDARWGDARYEAYEVALAQAEGDFVEYQALNIATQTSVDVFDNALGTPLPKAPSADELGNSAEGIKEEIEKKALALGEAELDAKLRSYNIDPAQFTDKPKEDKAKLLEKSFFQHCVTKAFGSLAGVRTLQTFEGLGADGHWQIGVLIVQTPKMTALAKTISEGSAASRGFYPPDPPLSEQVAATPDTDMLMDFGVRTLIDQHGDPSIIAFGQCPITDVGTSVVAREMVAGDAASVAKKLAQAAISEFANAEVQTNGGLGLGGDYDMDQTRAEHTAYFRQLNSQFNRTSSLQISGLVTLRKFRAKHPKSGQEFVGVVLAWSPTSQEQAKHVLDAAPQTSQGPAITPGATQGNDYDKHIKDW